MPPRTCPDCEEEITYRSCQQADTENVAALAMWVHRKAVHGDVSSLEPDLMGKAFAELMAARETEARADG